MQRILTAVGKSPRLIQVLDSDGTCFYFNAIDVAEIHPHGDRTVLWFHRDSGTPNCRLELDQQVDQVVRFIVGDES